jgi:hypothetical protein
LKLARDRKRDDRRQHESRSAGPLSGLAGVLDECRTRLQDHDLLDDDLRLRLDVSSAAVEARLGNGAPEACRKTFTKVLWLLATAEQLRVLDPDREIVEQANHALGWLKLL